MNEAIERMARQVAFGGKVSDALADEHLGQTHPELSAVGQARKRARRWADLSDAIDRRARELKGWAALYDLCREAESSR